MPIRVSASALKTQCTLGVDLMYLQTFYVIFAMKFPLMWGCPHHSIQQNELDMALLENAT
jgi:hypothetical protein